MFAYLPRRSDLLLLVSLGLIIALCGCKGDGKCCPPGMGPPLPQITPTATPPPFTPTVTNTLTPEPCIYFFEDFEDGDPQDGSPVTWLEETDSYWSIVGGVYRVESPVTFNFAICQEYANIADYILEYDVQLVSGYDRMICPRIRDQTNFFFLNFRNWEGGDYYMEAKGFDGSNRQQCWSGYAGYPNSPGEWHHIKFGAIGYIFAIEIEGHWYASCEDTVATTPYGNIALAGHGGSATDVVEFDNVLMRCPTDTEKTRILNSNITTYTYFDTSGVRPTPAPWPPDTISGN